MSFWKILFSLKGRISRQKFWMGWLLLWILSSVVVAISEYSTDSPEQMLRFVRIWGLFWLWGMLAIQVKYETRRILEDWVTLRDGPKVWSIE